MGIQIKRGNWGPYNIEHWRFYDDDGWEFSVEGRLHVTEQMAIERYMNDNDTEYGIIHVSAWPRKKGEE